MKHKEHIQKLYRSCLAGEGKHGVNGQVASLRWHIKRALADGVKSEVIEQWLRVELNAQQVQGGVER